MSNFSKSTNEYLREKMMKDPSSLTQTEKDYFDIDARNAAQSLVDRYKGRGAAFAIRAAQLAHQMGQEMLAQEQAKDRANAPQQSDTHTLKPLFGGDYE
jgi:hypothetical protein